MPQKQERGEGKLTGGFWGLEVAQRMAGGERWRRWTFDERRGVRQGTEMDHPRVGKNEELTTNLTVGLERPE